MSYHLQKDKNLIKSQLSQPYQCHIICKKRKTLQNHNFHNPTPHDYPLSIIYSWQGVQCVCIYIYTWPRICVFSFHIQTWLKAKHSEAFLEEVLRSFTCVTWARKHVHVPLANSHHLLNYRVFIPYVTTSSSWRCTPCIPSHRWSSGPTRHALGSTGMCLGTVGLKFWPQVFDFDGVFDWLILFVRLGKVMVFSRTGE